MKSLHYYKILKRVTNRLWDTLSDRDRATIVADENKQTQITKWFESVVASEATAKYESSTYWMNDPDSFKYAQYEN